MAIFTEYLERYGEDRVRACYALARGLMRGDRATFKAGYTADNALITVQEAVVRDGCAELDHGEADQLGHLLDDKDSWPRKRAIVAVIQTLPMLDEEDPGFQEQGEEIARLCYDYGTFQDLDDHPGQIDPSYPADPYHWHVKLRRARNSCDRFFDVLNEERDCGR